MTFEPSELRSGIVSMEHRYSVMKSDLAMGFGPGDSRRLDTSFGDTREGDPHYLAENLRQIHDESPAEFRLFTDNRTKHKGVVKMLVCLLTTYRAIDALLRNSRGLKSRLDGVLREARTNLGRVEVENSPGPFNFAHSICRLVRDKNRAQAFLNFQVAAMHLNYISEGNTDLPDRLKTSSSN
ncbi:hypothetical protein BD779DRAFT_1679588 [Infundibulicybe gibba]|nr:hypothetical protein BD779DRAFT_1679588 [Infundibulicybe gibba]